MIRHVLNFITSNILYALVGLTLGFSACQTYWYSNPIVPSVKKDSSVIKVCLPTPFEQNIVGNWHFQTRTKISKSGIVSFNLDKTVTDPDSLFKIISNNSTLHFLPVQKEIYSLETFMTAPLNPLGEFFIVRPYGLDNMGNTIPLGLIYYKIQLNECAHITLGVAGGSDDLDVDLIR